MSENHLFDPYDASDPEQIERARQQTEMIEDEKRDFMIGALRTRGGRAWFWGLLMDCGLSLKTIGATAEVTQFFDGKREIGWQLMRTLATANPEGFALMLKEHNV